jgi:hypothetical protein
MISYTLADGRRRADVTLEMPTGYREGEGELSVSLASIQAGFIPNAQEQVLFDDFQMGPSGSDTVTQKPLGTKGNVQVFTASNFDANLSILRSISDGEPDDNDTLYSAVGEKGVISYWFRRNHKLATIPLAVGDRGFIYECLSDDAQEQDGEEGYIVTPVPLSIRSRRPFVISA